MTGILPDPIGASEIKMPAAIRSRRARCTCCRVPVSALVILLTTGAAAATASPRHLRVTFEAPNETATAPLPANLRLPDVVRPLVTTMWRQSITFRRQCARLAENPTVVVTIEIAPRTRHGRALTRVERHHPGISAFVEIELSRPELYVEHIAHELEHILEDVDGVDLPRLARQGLDGVVDMGGQYETARARAVGQAVAHEALLQ